MQTLSLNLDRPGNALRALRQSYDPSSKDKASLGVDCLALVIRQLAEEGLPTEDLQPLIELEAVLKQQRLTTGVVARERRRGKAPSEAVLAPR